MSHSTNQLRKHLKFTLLHKIRQFTLRRKIDTLGENVFIEKNVKILRFPKNVQIGNQVVLKEGARICSCNQNAKINIGENTTFGYHSFLFSSESIEIGNNCLIAPFVYIVDSDHNIEKGKLINEQPNSTAPVKIGNDVWIGTGAKILKGVSIENGAVIAAGAIVRNDVKAYEIHGGIPAKKISDRK
jgi:acetyltransferase-like isoleucine patch superfamily enzyme